MSGSNTSVELPILDMSLPVQPSRLTALAEACREWGFFRVANHGISRGLYAKIYSLSQHIFSLPPETKSKLGPSSCVKTYTPHFPASPFYECLRVSGPNFSASAQSSADVIFDRQSPEFSEVLQEYGRKMTELSERILEISLMSLGDCFDRTHYESEFQNCHGYLRITNYTPPDTLEGEVEGLGKHTDMSCVTIVHQDQVGGLQVRSKEGKWMDVAPCQETLVINIGDMLQAWSNDRFMSSEHRVVLRRPVNRFSLAFFWCFEDEKVILAPNEVVGEGHARKYKPFVCAEYIKFRENSERGKFEKVGYTVRDFAAICL